MLLMECVSKIRRWVLVEGRSIRSVARATGLSRNTIKKYPKDERPPSYQRQAPPVLHKLCNGFDLRLPDLFEQDLKRPRRERRTAQKLYEQLVTEGYTGSYSPVQRFVRDLRPLGRAFDGYVEKTVRVPAPPVWFNMPACYARGSNPLHTRCKSP